MKKRKLTIIISFIFLSVPFIQTQPVNGINSTTIYVDDDNTNGPWDGSLKHPFQYIQNGIDEADYGDTVFVYSGVYQENLQITESIMLKGQNKNTTTINGVLEGRNVLQINENQVCITGFTITNGDTGIFINHSCGNTIVNNCLQDNVLYGICLDDFSNNSIIENNRIQNNRHGVILLYSSNNTILNNSINQNDHGITVTYSLNTFITHNTISENGVGLRVSDSSDQTGSVYTNTTITENDFLFNGLEFSGSANNTCSHNRITKAPTGMYLSNTNHNMFAYNKFINCTKEGIQFWQSKHNIICNNYFIHCGIFLKYTESTDNKFSDNLVNNKRFLFIKDESNLLIDENEWGQIVLAFCSNATITHQQINNSSVAIQLLCCTDCKIMENMVTFNQIGIHLDESKNNEITTNDVIRNQDYGISCISCIETHIAYNQVKHNGIGIQLGDAAYETKGGKNNNIQQNSISFNQIGIKQSIGKKTRVHCNQINHNEQNGIVLNACTNCIIDHNNITQNKGMALFLGYHHFIFTIEGKNNAVKCNNFIENSQNAYFKINAHTTWDYNYWDTPLLIPYPIFGTIPFLFFSLPWINIDFHPSSEPYNIEGRDNNQ